MTCLLRHTLSILSSLCRPQQTPSQKLPELILPEAFALDELSDLSHYDNTEARFEFDSSWFEEMIGDSKEKGERSIENVVCQYPNTLIDLTIMKLGITSPNKFIAGQCKIRKPEFD